MAPECVGAACVRLRCHTSGESTLNFCLASETVVLRFEADVGRLPKNGTPAILFTFTQPLRCFSDPLVFALSAIVAFTVLVLHDRVRLLFLPACQCGIRR